MQLNKNKVSELKLKDLFFQLLYRWRSILIVALIAAAVLCGYQYLSVKITHDAGKLTKEERQYQIDLQQYHEDLATNRNAVKVYSKLIQEQNDYLDKSIYINLAPQNAWVASNKYLVKGEQTVAQGANIDPLDSVLPIYSAPLAEVTDVEALKKAFGTEDIDYVSELVITLTNPEDNTVTVYVLGETKESAQEGLSLIHQQMEKLSDEKAKVSEPHQLVLVSESISRGVDSIRGMSQKIDLAAKQETLAKITEENQNALRTARQNIDKLEANGEPKAPGMHLPKMAVIGFILGGILMLFIYAATYIFRGTVNNASELTDRYNLPIFGSVPKSGHLHAYRGLDKLFSRWELGKDAQKVDIVYDNICALISKNEDAKTILLVSSLPEAKLNKVRDELTKRLSEKTIDVIGNMLHSNEVVPEAIKADEVIVVEETHASRIEDIDRMAETLMICKANVIGCITI